MSSPRYLVRRCPSLVVWRATRLRNSTYLPQHTQRIVVGPTILYLVAGYAVSDDPGTAIRLPLGVTPISSP